MTTVIRRGDVIVADSRFVRIVGQEVPIKRNMIKYFRHPTNKAVIAITGGITRKVFFNALWSDIGQLLVEMIDYPNTLPTIPELSKLAKDKSSRQEAGITVENFGIMVCMEHWTVYIDMCVTDGAHVNVQSAKELMVIGTGGTSIALLENEFPELTLEELMRLAIKTDSDSGGLCSVSQLKLVSL